MSARIRAEISKLNDFVLEQRRKNDVDTATKRKRCIWFCLDEERNDAADRERVYALLKKNDVDGAYALATKDATTTEDDDVDRKKVHGIKITSRQALIDELVGTL